ncbi:n-6 adenine-specific DNA methyltransferase 2 [Niveomyces insectorum RCEF 264]|uniref:Protein-lysine N-methyltransferase EFM5 n=1 Tax=Niveomyces insectorum RCEF 264 TaxID=1081102 RepID=A0A167MV92_9HYPO|nr:n-6 adenine-specific DNA methyltransferase 2 [Niveomyces insectorum RCEF 264]
MALEEEDGDLSLPPSTLEALQAFYAERDEHARRFADLRAAAEAAAEASAQASVEADKLPVPLSMAAFNEDWNESQFWYSDETARTFAQRLLEGTDASSTVVVVSAPSAFVALKNLVATRSVEQRPRLFLLEHDTRFAVFGAEFVPYDYQEPTKLPSFLRGAADRIICDPPFLSDDCQTKAALTVRWLGKTTKAAETPEAPGVRVIVCTGERMAPLITAKLYAAQGVRTTTYEPHHARGLGNEFYCYANFECDDWNWVKNTE